MDGLKMFEQWWIDGMNSGWPYDCLGIATSLARNHQQHCVFHPCSSSYPEEPTCLEQTCHRHCKQIGAVDVWCNHHPLLLVWSFRCVFMALPWPLHLPSIVGSVPIVIDCPFHCCWWISLSLLFSIPLVTSIPPISLSAFFFSWSLYPSANPSSGVLPPKQTAPMFPTLGTTANGWFPYNKWQLLSILWGSGFDGTQNFNTRQRQPLDAFSLSIPLDGKKADFVVIPSHGLWQSKKITSYTTRPTGLLCVYGSNIA